MGHRDRTRSAAELAVIERVRGLCRRLPEVAVEVDGFGHTSFRVAKKPFVIIGAWEDGEPSLSFKADHTTQEALIRRGRHHRTPYIGQHGWVSYNKDAAVDWGEVEDLVLDGYRRVAPKRLLRQVESP